MRGHIYFINNTRRIETPTNIDKYVPVDIKLEQNMLKMNIITKNIIKWPNNDDE